MALLGENGTGKTTLLTTLAGRLTPLAGTVTPGHDVSIGYYDQELSDLDPRRRAIDAVWDQHPEETEEEMRSYLARFAFRGDEVFAPIAGLSGGEKGRLTLAVVMRQRHNLLLLDEPTNHLDLDSREALEESLDDFPGSIVFVSHDRAFIDRLATRVLDIRGGRARLYDGNYTETADARAERRKTPERDEVPSSKFQAPSGPPPSKRRAVSTESKVAARRKRRIETLEEKIAALEEDIEAIETRLWEEGLVLGPVESHRLSEERTQRRQELERLIEEWAKLSEREEPAPDDVAGTGPTGLHPPQSKTG
jgi:ATP-binding cassette subfamily F protein 3